MKKPVLSLVTGKVGRDESFVRLLNSICQNTECSWELVVSDASDEPFKAALSNVRVLHEKPRKGCVVGYNEAFKACRGEWVIFLNDDAEVMPGYASAALSFMKNHPSIGLGALHYSEDGSPFHINSAWNIPYANFGIIRRLLGDQVGWFDDDLTMYGNDNSLTFRVLLAGYGIGDIPDAKVIHHSVKDQTRVENQSTRSRDNDTLQRKYLPRLNQMIETYQEHKASVESQAWSHGRTPISQ